MYKKILLLLTILVLFFSFTLKDYADAAIASKAATTAAKQIVKEYVKDKAVETAANFALMEAMEIADKYQAKQGYKIVCPDGSKTCTKPVQVKETLTDTDKQALKGQAGIELDKLITNGKGMSAWQKFLDWFIPVWAVSFAATAITYAMDGEVRSMFNEAAYNALVALGFITPITQNEALPLEEVEEKTNQDESGVTYEGKPVTSYSASLKFNPSTSQVPYSVSAVLGSETFNDKGVIQLNFFGEGMKVYIVNMETGVAGKLGGLGTSSIRTLAPSSFKSPYSIVSFNGTNVFEGTPSTNSSETLVNHTQISTDVSVLNTQLKSIQFRAPYELNGFWYTDVLYDTVSGDAFHFQTRSVSPVTNNLYKKLTFKTTVIAPNGGSATMLYMPNVEPLREILVPTYDELITGGENVVPEGNYEKDGKVAFIPPAAITYQEESTGETVVRSPAPGGSGVVFEKPDGTPVPEENVVANPTPTVTENPQGIPEYTPAPTPSNPAPTPQPLTPTPTPSTPTDPHPNPNPVQPPGTNPPGTDEPPMEPFPEGEKCLETLKFPIFSPLKETFTTAFPFSIPWDIGRAIEAAFGGIGSEKPEYEIKIDTAGVNQTFKITTPAFFDKWKPFTDSLLVFTFDVLIMFGIFRFVKGAGS